MQDIVILYKKEGHFEPVLGQPDPLGRPPLPNYGFVDWLLGR
jgi:hypothetical protein